ncbi:MAG: hypothetical protein ABL927_09905 [Bdellovibrionales bacterium]
MDPYKLDTILGFGKYKNNTIEYVILNDNSYVLWCIITIEGFVISLDAAKVFYENRKSIVSRTTPVEELFSSELLTSEDYFEIKIKNVLKTNLLKLHFLRTIAPSSL